MALNYADGKVFWKNSANAISSFTFAAYAAATHAASHESGGTDPLYDQDLNTDNQVEFAAISVGTSPVAEQITVLRTEASQQNSVVKGVSTEDTDPTDETWRGRAIFGARNLTFLMGAYQGVAGLGAHSWTDSLAESGAAWADVAINPDGGANVHIGCQLWDTTTSLVQVSNSDGSVVIRGLVVLPLVPTSDPSVEGALWSDGGTLKVSAG